MKDNWSDYSKADGGWDSSEGVDSYLAGCRKTIEENKTEINMHDELVKSLSACYRLLRSIEGAWDNPRISGVSEQQYNAYKTLQKAEKKIKN